MMMTDRTSILMNSTSGIMIDMYTMTSSPADIGLIDAVIPVLITFCIRVTIYIAGLGYEYVWYQVRRR